MSEWIYAAQKPIGWIGDHTVKSPSLSRSKWVSSSSPIKKTKKRQKTKSNTTRGCRTKVKIHK